MENITKVVVVINDFKPSAAYLCEALLQGNTPLCTTIDAAELQMGSARCSQNVVSQKDPARDFGLRPKRIIQSLSLL